MLKVGMWSGTRVHNINERNIILGKKTDLATRFAASQLATKSERRLANDVSYEIARTEAETEVRTAWVAGEEVLAMHIMGAVTQTYGTFQAFAPLVGPEGVDALRFVARKAVFTYANQFDVMDQASRRARR